MAIYKLGTMIGNYEIVSKPMIGGMGVVYFCLDHRNNKKPVALKTFKPEFLPNREARNRFLREGTAWINLGSHPNIVKCHAVEYIDPIAFLSLELIAKEQDMEDASLRSWMGSPMKVEQALLFALQISRGLQHAITKIPGFVHRDLKPENILVGADKLPSTNVNRLRVTDFGLATMLKNEGGRQMDEKDGAVGRTHLTRGIVGTPLYMAPEQWKGEDVGVYTDVYALGCILFEMLTAIRAVDGRTVNDLRFAHCEGRVRSLPEGIPSGASSLLKRCLLLTPKNRYQGWEEITNDLEKVYADVAGYAAPASEICIDKPGNEERKEEGSSYTAIGIAYLDIGKMEAATRCFEKSLLIARELGNRDEEWFALCNIVCVYLQTENRQDIMIGYIEKVLAVARETGEPNKVGSALINLGAAYIKSGKPQHAIGYLEQSLEIYRKLEDRRTQGAILGNLGNAYTGLRDMQRAIGYYERALSIAQEIGDRRGEIKSLGALGEVYQDFGEVRRAIEYHQQELAIAQERGDRFSECKALGGLGIAYRGLGEIQQAIRYCEQYLAIAREIGDRSLEGNALGNLGTTYRSLGKVQQAISFYEQELAITCEIGNRHGEGNAVGNLGNAYFQLREVPRAIGYYEQQLEIAREISDRRGEGYALGNLGVSYMSLGETQRAIGYYEQSIAIRRILGDVKGIALDSFNMALLYSNRGEFSRALSLAQESARIWSQIGSPDVLDAQKLIAKLQGEKIEQKPEYAIQSAFDAFQHVDSPNTMQTVIGLYPFMKEDAFIQGIERTIKEQIPPNLKPIFEQRLNWLKQIAGKQQSGFGGR